MPLPGLLHCVFRAWLDLARQPRWRGVHPTTTAQHSHVARSLTCLNGWVPSGPHFGAGSTAQHSTPLQQPAAQHATVQSGPPQGGRDAPCLEGHALLFSDMQRASSEISEISEICKGRPDTSTSRRSMHLKSERFEKSKVCLHASPSIMCSATSKPGSVVKDSRPLPSQPRNCQSRQAHATVHPN